MILVAVKDAEDDANFLKSNTARVGLGKLKGNEGDQNYEIPAGTDLAKFQTVSMYCERFSANLGSGATGEVLIRNWSHMESVSLKRADWST